MNVGTLLTKAARHFGSNLAIAHGCRTWTYRQFNHRVNRLASALRALGVAPGDNVALLMFNGPQMLEAMFASFKLGCGAVPLNFRLHSSEFALIVDHCQASVVVHSPEFNDSLAAVRDRLPRVRYDITLSDARGDVLDYETVLAGGSEQFEDTGPTPVGPPPTFPMTGTDKEKTRQKPP